VKAKAEAKAEAKAKAKAKAKKWCPKKTDNSYDQV
jgi:hypothetical protein